MNSYQFSRGDNAITLGEVFHIAGDYQGVCRYRSIEERPV